MFGEVYIIGSFVLNSDCGLIYNRFGDTLVRQWAQFFIVLGQLHMSRLFVVEVVDNVDLLCPSIVCLMFRIQL
jgi:hypothetical protein